MIFQNINKLGDLMTCDPWAVISDPIYMNLLFRQVHRSSVARFHSPQLSWKVLVCVTASRVQWSALF